MSEKRDSGAALARWLEADAPRSAPGGLVDGVLSVTSSTRPLPRWRAMLGTTPMQRPAVVLLGSPTLRIARILVVLLAVVTLVAVGGLIGAGGQRSPATDTSIGYRLDLGDTWRYDPAHSPGERYWGRVASGAVGGDGVERYIELTVVRPTHVFEPWASTARARRERAPVPQDLVGWFLDHRGLRVIDVERTSLGERPATSIEARPLPSADAKPETWEARHWTLVPGVFLDIGWRYEFILAELPDAKSLVVACGGPEKTWLEASLACDELLATWEWVER